MRKDVKKEEILKILFKSVERYHSTFIDKSILIIFSSNYYYDKNTKFDYKVIRGSKNNFKHLTGVISSLRASDFYDKCLNKSLSIKDFEKSSNFDSLQKLDVLEKACGLYRIKQGGEFNRKGKVDFEYGIGNTNYILGLSAQDDENNIYFLKSLLNLNINEAINKPSYHVFAIFCKDNNEKSYTFCIENRQGLDLSTIKFNKEIDVLLNKDNIQYLYNLYK